MGRVRRSELPPGMFHVVTRGVAGLAVFRDPVDRNRFLLLLGKVVDESRWRVEAYCLMTTHYHLIVIARPEDLSNGMRKLNGDYARTYNKRHARRGHVFAERFSSWVVEDDDHVANTVRYVLLNPVRAGLVARPQDWPWNGLRSGL